MRHKERENADFYIPYYALQLEGLYDMVMLDTLSSLDSLPIRSSQRKSKKVVDTEYRVKKQYMI